MTMTRAHFKLIAEIIGQLPTQAGTYLPRLDAAQSFARALRATNPKFNSSRFLRACGVE